MTPLLAPGAGLQIMESGQYALSLYQNLNDGAGPPAAGLAAQPPPE